MSSASAQDRRSPVYGRWQRGLALLLSLLIEALMFWLLIAAATPTVGTPQGASGGSRMRVDLLGEAPKPEPPQPTPPKPKPARKRPASPPVISTLVEHSSDPQPPEDPAPLAEDMWSPNKSEPQPVTTPPTPTTANRSAAPPSSQRYHQRWSGQPPGMEAQNMADQDQGNGSDMLPGQGQGRTANGSGPSLAVGGYMVYYDLHSETQLRIWQQQGMKEIFLPLPGTRYYMICPVEIALHRDAGKCRLLPPDSAELTAIGDAREVINIMQVYHKGDLVWRGPGAYR